MYSSEEKRNFFNKLKNSTVSIDNTYNTENKYITVYNRNFSDGRKYQFIERFGRDSLAFVLYDENKENKFGVLNQYHPPLNKYVCGAFTGSLDKNKGLINILLDEIKEESGYIIPKNDLYQRIYSISKQPVSSQTNEQVNLYLIDVTNLTQGKKFPDSDFEKFSYIQWASINYILTKCEWKSRLITLQHLIGKG